MSFNVVIGLPHSSVTKIICPTEITLYCGHDLHCLKLMEQIVVYCGYKAIQINSFEITHIIFEIVLQKTVFE